MSETLERIDRAIASLDERVAALSISPNRNSREIARLSGKIEGVKLARAYLEEGIRSYLEEEERSPEEEFAQGWNAAVRSMRSRMKALPVWTVPKGYGDTPSLGTTTVLPYEAVGQVMSDFGPPPPMATGQASVDAPAASPEPLSVHVATMSVHWSDTPIGIREKYEGKFVQVTALVPIEHMRRLRLGDDALQVILPTEQEASDG